MGLSVEICTNNAKDPKDLVDSDWVEVAVEPRPHGIISFGRDAEACTIDIASSCGIEGVRYRHCALVFAGGSFRIDFDRDCRVFVSNSILDFDPSARPGAKLNPIHQLHNPFLNADTFYMRLGQPFVVQESRNPLIRVTKKDADVKERKRFTRKQMARLRRGEMDTIDLVRKTDRNVRRQTLTLGGLAIALGAGLITLAAFFVGLRTLERAQAELRENVTMLQAQTPAQTWIAETAPSVAQLMIETKSGTQAAGTAWLWCYSDNPNACAPDTDKPPVYLVTNAHVLNKLQAAARANIEEEPMYAAIFPRRHVSEAPVKIVLEDADMTRFVAHPFNSDSTRTQQERRASAYDLAVVRLSAKQNNALGERLRFQIETTRTPREGDLSLSIGYPVEGSQNASDLEDPTPTANWTRLNRRVTPFYGHISLLGLINDKTCDAVKAAHEAGTSPGKRSLLMPAYYSLFSTSLGGVSGGPIIDRCSKKVFAIAQSQDSIDVQSLAEQLDVDDIPVGALLYAISIDGLLDFDPGTDAWATTDHYDEIAAPVLNPVKSMDWSDFLNAHVNATNVKMSRFYCRNGAITETVETLSVKIEQELDGANGVIGAAPADGRARDAWRYSVPGGGWYSILARSDNFRYDFVSIDVTSRDIDRGLDLISSWRQKDPASGIGTAKMAPTEVGIDGTDIEILVSAPMNASIKAAILMTRCAEPGEA